MGSAPIARREENMSRGSYFGLAVIIVFSIFAVFAPIIAPHDPTHIFENALMIPPFQGVDIRNFYFGTDDVGRDVLSRLIYGARFSLGLGLLVVVVTVLVGGVLGVLAASFEGLVDQVISRAMDILLALPSILLAIVVVAVLGPSLVNTVISIAIVGLPNMVRLVRSSVLIEKRKIYVMALKSYGASWFRIYIINILPNCMAPLIVQATFGFSDGILNAAALGFLGLGVQPPNPEWGTMLSDSRQYIESAGWLVTLPGLCILIVVLSFNLLGDGLRDHLDPKSKRV